MTKNCYWCNKIFEIPKYKPNAMFCSAECRFRGNGRLSAEARGNVQRGRGEGKGYRKWMGAHEHRKIMENLLGRKLGFNEVVHHKDGNRLNNSLENLEVITRSEHSRLHSTKNRLCEVEGCSSKHRAKGFCNKHYKQNRMLNKLNAQ